MLTLVGKTAQKALVGSSTKIFPTTTTSFSIRPPVVFVDKKNLVRCMMSNSKEGSKPGIASVEEIQSFMKAAGDKLVVVDVRNPDATAEPGDQKSLAVAPLPDPSNNVRPKAIHLLWDRTTNSMPLPPSSVTLDTPIITHCGGGGRGQLSKEFLMSNGYSNVINGAGPKETERWAEFGNK